MAAQSRNRTKWDTYYKQLCDFYNAFGTFRIPHNNNEYKALRLWIQLQRASKKHMPADRIEKLLKIGFVFDPNKMYWEEKLLQYKSYIKKTGLFHISYRNSKYYELSIWLYNQRRLYKAKKLSKERAEVLRKLGFKFS